MREGLLKKAFEVTGISPVNRDRIPDSAFSALELDAVGTILPVADAEVQEGDDTGDDPPSIPDEAGATANPEDIAQVKMAEVTRAAVPIISFDDMDQLQFRNGLMIDITEDYIEQAVEAYNSDQLADALPSTTATSKHR